MPIYEQTYRRYEARAPLTQLRFWPITREALRLVLMKRAFLGLLALSFLPFVVRVVQVYVVTRFPEAGRVLPVDGRMFGEFLNQQVGFTLLLTIFGGAGLVANDLRTGAIVMYLARPLTRRDYVLGKLGTTFLLNLAVTLAPGLLLYGVALALAPDQFLKWELAWIAPAIVTQAFVMSFCVSLLGLAVSSLTKSARVSGLAFFAFIVGLELVRQVLDQGFDRSEATLLSVQDNLRNLSQGLFGLGERGASMPWPASAAVLLALAIGCLFVLRRRVRAVEIVS
jgi:ABC-2 type transport system permease protein